THSLDGRLLVRAGQAPDPARGAGRGLAARRGRRGDREAPKDRHDARHARSFVHRQLRGRQRLRSKAFMTVYADLLRYRELFGNLFRRDVQAKYRGSLLGVAWTLANPVLLMAVYLLVFSVLWKTRFGSDGHYALFLLVGLSAWIFFATSLQAASRSMLDNANLIRKTRFPRQLVPLSIVATHLISFGVMLLVLVPLNFALLPRVRATEWLAIPIAVGVVAIASGLALA